MIEAIDTHLEVIAPARPQCVRELRAKAAEFACELRASPDTVEDVRLAVNEALLNVAMHAYGDRDGSVEMIMDCSADELTVLVRDHGVGVDHPSKSDGAGYGLHIIERTTLRSSVFSTLGRGTEVTMVFRVPGSGS